MIDLSKLLTDQYVKQQRGWHTEKCGDTDQWVVPQLSRWIVGDLKVGCVEAMYQRGHDVGLLTKADAWYVANIEAKDVLLCERCKVGVLHHSMPHSYYGMPVCGKCDLEIRGEQPGACKPIQAKEQP